MDVSDFPRRLGLERYLGAFVENAIDAETLALLINAYLKELGVAALGHRGRGPGKFQRLIDRAEAAGTLGQRRLLERARPWSMNADRPKISRPR